jgi:exosortase
MRLQPKSWINRREAYFIGLTILAAAIFYRPLAIVVGSSFSVDQYSQVLVVPPLSGLLLYMEKKRIFARVSFSQVGAALYVVFMGTFAYLARYAGAMDASNYISLSVLLFIACCIAAFLFCYGFHPLRAGAFPVFFLILMTPLPDKLRNHTITFLQYGSAEITDWLFTAAHIPFTRTGVILALPTVTIEIAQECSGIRSSLMLVITGLILGHLFLRSGWSKLALLVLLIPFTIIKNSIRIFTLSTLGMYVNPSFLTGRLHHEGGIVFFALALAGVWVAIWLLQKLENSVMRGSDRETVRDVVVGSS